jgi:hypothetical protein
VGLPDATECAPSGVAPLSAPTYWRRVRSGAALRVKRSPAGLALLRMLRIGATPAEYVERRRMARAHLAAHPTRLQVNPELGYRRVSAQELPQLREFVELSRELCVARARVLEHMHGARAGKHRIVFDILSDARLAADARWLEFALCDELLSSAVDYLGEAPVLSRVGVGVSLPSATEEPPAHSQLFHVDADDARQLKLLVNISHVEREDGPFSWLPAAVSERVQRSLRGGLVARVAAQRAQGATTTPRYWDHEVGALVSERLVERLEGPPGTAVLIDTARCLHFGSRVRPGRRRVVSAVLFERFHRALDSPFNVFDSERYAGDPLRWRALQTPRPCAPGTFYPEPDSGVLAPQHARGAGHAEPQ